MKFCEKLIRLRKSRRMTQDEFAHIIGVSRQAVYKWECGQSYPEALKLVAIKELFGISIDDMLDEGFTVEMPVRAAVHRHRSPSAPEKQQRDEEQMFDTPSGQQAASRPETAEAAPAESEPAPYTATAIEQEQPAPQPEEPKKKPGFFARLFKGK